MDYSDEEPERLWITQPEKHLDLMLSPYCGRCNANIDLDHSVPMLRGVGPLCQQCATESVQDHPLTPTYLQWLQTGDPRWFSAWCCNCEGCVPHEVPA